MEIEISEALDKTHTVEESLRSDDEEPSEEMPFHAGPELHMQRSTNTPEGRLARIDEILPSEDEQSSSESSPSGSETGLTLDERAIESRKMMKRKMSFQDSNHGRFLSDFTKS